MHGRENKFVVIGNRALISNVFLNHRGASRKRFSDKSKQRPGSFSINFKQLKLFFSFLLTG